MATDNGNAKTTVPKMDVRVPLDWHPSIATATCGPACPPGSIGGSILQTGVGALAAITETFGRVLDAKAALHASATPLVTDAMGQIVSGTATQTRGRDIQVTGREAELDRSMMLAFNKVSPRVEGALVSMKKQKAVLEERLAAAFREDSKTREYAHEIRNHFRDSNKINEAIKLIETAPEAEAKQIAVALYRPGAPSFLSPAKPEQLARLRAAAAARFAKQDWEQLNAAGRVITQLENARESFVKRFARERPKFKAGARADDALAALVK